MLKKFVLMALLGFSSMAIGGSAPLTWTHATTNTDGSALVDRSGYKIYYGTSPTNLTSVLTVPASATSYTVPNLAGGNTWYFAIATVSTTLGEGDKTAPVSLVIPAPKPLPPTDLKVGSTTAYTVVKKVDGFVMLPVGSVPADTPCIMDQTVNGYYAVPRVKVEFSGSVQPDVVLAQCV